MIFIIDRNKIPETDEVELRSIRIDSKYLSEIEFPPKIQIRVNNFGEVKVGFEEEQHVTRRKDTAILIKEDLLSDTVRQKIELNIPLYPSMAKN